MPPVISLQQCAATARALAKSVPSDYWMIDTHPSWRPQFTALMLAIFGDENTNGLDLSIPQHEIVLQSKLEVESALIREISYDPRAVATSLEALSVALQAPQMPQLALLTFPTPPSTEAWVVEKQIGKGGQGEAHLVRHSVSAIQGARKKILHADEKSKIRFIREISYVKTISHPNIIKVLDSSVDKTAPWVIYEYVPGGDLFQHMGLYKDDVTRVLRCARDLASGLMVAHKAGIIHRDIKPKNILVRSLDCWILTDFGIAHNDLDDTVTSADEKVTNHFYGAPETFSGRIDSPLPSIDIFSIGKLIYHAYYGTEPVNNSALRQDGGTLNLETKRRAAGINNVISHSFRKNANDRVSDLDKLIDLIDLAMYESPVSSRDPNECDSCGRQQAMHSFGRIEPGRTTELFLVAGADRLSIASINIHLLICRYCGHVQLVSKDLNPSLIRPFRP